MSQFSRLGIPYLVLVAVVLLTATPALVFLLIACWMDLTQRDFPDLPQSVGIAFFAFGALAPFSTPFAVVGALLVTFFKSVTARQKLFCWALALGAVGATLLILSTFTKMGK